MKRITGLAAMVAAATVLAVTNPADGQVGRGGGRPGGGGGARPGGGGARPNFGGGGARPNFGGGGRPAAPNIQRPATPPQRPNIQRPPGGINPGMVPQRPNIQRPTAPPQRPNIGGGPNIINRPTPPNISRPGGPNIVNRPSPPNITRPTPGDRPNLGGARPGIVPRPTPPVGRPGIGDRPNITRPTPGDRPGITRPNPGDRPNITRPNPGDRPTIPRPDRPGIINRPDRPGGDRPGLRPDRPVVRPDRPGIIDRPDRPGSGVRPDRPWDRPGVRPDRPGINIGDRVINNNVNNINVNRWNNWNNNRGWWNRPGNWNRPWYGGRPGWYYGRPWYWNHAGWHHGYWNNWNVWPAFWTGAVVGSAWLGAGGDTFVFNNPFYVQPATTLVYNYSVPLPVPVADQVTYAFPPEPADDAAALPPVPNDDSNVTKANRRFDQAREAFKRGDFGAALTEVDAAIGALPSDATLHEFRALTLFAQGRFTDAASTLYAVLAAGPGWDWATLAALYGDPALYTQHLRALEDYVRKNPNDGAARFVLAYHYLVIGNKDAAVSQLKEVVRIIPGDKLAGGLIEALTAPPGGGTPMPPAPGG